MGRWWRPGLRVAARRLLEFLKIGYGFSWNVLFYLG